MDPEMKKALEALGMTQREAIDAQMKAHKEFTDTVTSDSKKRDAAYDEKIAKLQTELDKFEPLSAAIKASEEKAAAAETDRKAVQEQLDRMEAKIGRPATPSSEDEAKAKAKERFDAMDHFLRKGRERAEKERLNVLTLADDTTGGYLAVPEYVAELIKDIVEFSPMRKLVTVRRTSQRQVQFPKRTGVFTASWVGEIESRSENTGLTFGLEDVPIHEQAAESYVSFANIDDSEFDLPALLRSEFAEQFGVAEGIALISGNGVKKPQGFLNAASTNSVNSGAATTVTADGIISLKYAVKTVYAQNGTYLLNRGTLEAIRKLKDGNGNWVWQPGLAVGRPNTLDGDPYVECPDMPALGAGNKSMAYGDWRRAMVLIDRMDISLLVDPYTRAGSGQMKYVARKRLGGQVVLPTAIAIMTVSA